MRENALMVPGHPRPALIAHSAGNARRSAEAALTAAVDFIEVDLWVHRGRFEVRHERRAFFPVPVLFEKWYLRIAPRRPFSLADLFEYVDGRTGIFLDLKNGGETAANLLRRSIDDAGYTGPIVASSQSWSLLRDLRERCPEATVLYSVDVREKLDLLFQVIERDNVPAGVSCSHTLLTHDMVALLRERGLLVSAWTVNDPGRARELAAWGVAAIATDSLGPVSEALERM